MREFGQSRLGRVLVISCVVYVSACDHMKENTAVIRVADWPDHVQTITETDGFRMGEPGHEGYIGQGWDIVEQDEAGRFFRWAVGDTVDLVIPVTKPRDISVSIKWAPPPLEPGQYQGFIARFNGREIDRSIIASHRFTEQEIAIPSELVQIGYNRLRIIPSRKAILDQDPRPLRFCVREVRWSRPPKKRMSIEDRRRIRTLRERTDQLSLIHVGGYNAVYIPVFLEAGSEIHGTAHHLGMKGMNRISLHIRGHGINGTSIPLYSDEIAASQRSMDFEVRIKSPVGAVSFTSDAQDPDGIGLSELEFLRHGIDALDRSILLVTIDDFRAEDVQRPDFPAPTIRRIRERGLWCSGAVTPAVGTQPFYASLFSGHYPHIHNVINDEYTLSTAAPTIATELKEEGYFCIASVSDPRLSSSRTTLNRGFHVYTSRDDAPLHAHEVSNEAIEAIFSAQNSERPFFVWVQFGDIRYDLDPPEGSMRTFEGYASTRDTVITARMDRYTASIHAIDHEILRLIDALGALGKTDSISIFITSDQSFHVGESTGCSFLHHDRIRVPLIITAPRMVPPSSGLSSPVSSTDIFNIIKRCATFGPGSSHDVNIVRLLGSSRTRYGHIYCETGKDDTYAMIQWPYKLIRIGNASGVDPPAVYCLYNIRDDSEEVHDLSPVESERIRELVEDRSQSISATDVRYRPVRIR